MPSKEIMESVNTCDISIRNVLQQNFTDLKNFILACNKEGLLEK